MFIYRIAVAPDTWCNWYRSCEAENHTRKISDGYYPNRRFKLKQLENLTVELPTNQHAISPTGVSRFMKSGWCNGNVKRNIFS